MPVKKTFNSSYEQMYLINKDLYHKVMSNIGVENGERDELQTLNGGIHNEQVNQEESISNENVDSNERNINESILEKVDDLKRVIETNQRDTHTQTATDLKDSSTQIPPNRKSIGTQTTNVGTRDMSTQTTSSNVNSTGVQTKNLVKDSSTQVLSNPNTLNYEKETTETNVDNVKDNIVQNSEFKSPMKMRKRFYCETCNKGFSTNFSKKRHVNTQHLHSNTNKSEPVQVKMNRKRKVEDVSYENLKEMRLSGTKRKNTFPNVGKKFSKWN